MCSSDLAVLLLLWSGLVVVAGVGKDLQDKTADTAYQPDIHTVLREMSVLMAEQRVELRYTKTQIEAMETRLRASENNSEICVFCGIRYFELLSSDCFPGC